MVYLAGHHLLLVQLRCMVLLWLRRRGLPLCCWLLLLLLLLPLLLMRWPLLLRPVKEGGFAVMRRVVRWQLAAVRSLVCLWPPIVLQVQVRGALLARGGCRAVCGREPRGSCRSPGMRPSTGQCSIIAIAGAAGWATLLMIWRLWGIEPAGILSMLSSRGAGCGVGKGL